MRELKKGQENLRDELTHVKSQARVDQAQLIRNTDQCLAGVIPNKESYEREARMTREIERLLNDHDSTYAHTMTSLEKRLDAKSDLMMRKLDAILNGSNWQERSNPMERSRHANDGDGTGSNARAQQSSRTRSGQGQPRRGLAGRTQSRRRHIKVQYQMLPRRQGCQLCHKSVQYQI